MDVLCPWVYLTSCSISQNKSDWKNSVIVMSKPSQSFWIVATVVLLLRPLTILFTVDCVTPLLMERALIEISRSWQSPIILCRTASPILMLLHLFFCNIKERVQDSTCQGYLF